MKILFNKQFFLHNPDTEFDGAYRIKEFENVKDTSFEGAEFIKLVHEADYIKKIKDACMKEQKIAEIQLNKDSWKSACQSVGLSVLASEQMDFAVVRPAGHHAGRCKAEGFCLFNNIAIAAQKLANEGKKVFIFDFDAHHGNGTQDIFYDSNKVFYSSIHQIFTYPMTGFPEQQGEGEGEGFTMNIPLVPGSDDKDFYKAFDKVMEVARGFNPDVMAVSAGFDGYRKDKMMSLNYSLGLFYEVGLKLRRSFPNVFGVLEGGYHDAIRVCTDRFIEGINKGALPPRIKWDHGLAIG